MSLLANRVLITIKVSLVRLLSSLSLTVRMLLLTVIVGMSAGGALGMLLDKRINATLNEQLNERLTLKAQDDRSHFDTYMMSYHQSIKLLIDQVGFVNYVAKAGFATGGELKQPLIRQELPPWLPKTSVMRFFAHVEHSLIIDPSGRVREVYQAGDKPLPDQLLNPTPILIKNVHNQYFITTFDGAPYVLAGDTLMDDNGSALATMIIASPIDDNFFIEAVKPTNGEEAVVLVESQTKRLLCSNKPDVLQPGTQIDSLKGRYFMMGKSFLDYGESDISLQFISLISNKEVNRLKLIILSVDRIHRLLMASTLILSFMSILLYIMRRIKKVNTRIAEFSKNVLGVNGYIAAKGADQLAMLEGRFLRLFEEMTHTKSRLLEKTKELAANEQRIRSIIDNIPMGVITIHEGAKILSINPAAEMLFGYTASEAVGLGIDTFVGGELNVGNLAQSQSLVATWGAAHPFNSPNESKPFEMTGMRKDGSYFPIEVALSAVDFGPEGSSDVISVRQFVIAIIRDITRRKEAEDTIKKAKENLESRVEKRTSELSLANQQLSLEIIERKKAEELLRRNYDIQRVISTVLTIALAPLSLTEQLLQILQIILSIPWLSIQAKGCIFLVREDTPEMLEIVASHGFSDQLLATCFRLPFGKCVCGKAASLKRIVFTSEINELHDIRYDNVAQHGHYCVPIFSGNKVLGIINLYVAAGHIRDTQEEEFLSTIANTLTGIIERTFTERKLKHAQELFFSFMKNSPMAAFIKDDAGRYVYVNEQIARFTNRRVEDIVGKTDFDLFPIETAAEVRAHDDMVLAVNKTVDLLETFRQEDGIHQWLVIKFPFKDETGRRMLAGMSIDMTQRKRIEEALIKSEEKYHNIINTTPEGFFEIDRNLRVNEVNESLCHMLNMTKAEIIGQQPIFLAAGRTPAILHPSGGGKGVDGEGTTPFALQQGDDDELIGTLVSVLKTGNNVAANVSFKRNDGVEFHCRLNVSAIKDTSGIITGAFALLADISELVEMKNSLSIYARELKRSNEELQEFASVASHDLQEPLRKIIAFGDRLGEKYASAIPVEGRDYLSRMQGAAQRMQNLIDGLLNYARVSTRAKPFSPTDLNDVIKDVLSDLEVRLIKSSGQVETDALPTIDADRLQMHQLFMNLIGNGLKFHKEGVAPVVTVKSSLGHDGLCEITVSDNGIGFDEKHLDRLFKPFQRLVSREKYEGTGMGLAICEKIAKRHGGNIVAHSQPNNGSTFIIRLPYTTGARDKHNADNNASPIGDESY
ncbi:MAG: PAS domain S-box protein [Nitrospirae bacterium]|nr:PAS domain S-box protein [Nitrospirota bacterium]